MSDSDSSLVGREPKTNGRGGAMGLFGNAGILANLTCCGVVCLLLYRLLEVDIPREHELFRNELAAIRRHDEGRNRKILDIAINNQAAIVANQKAIENLVEEMRHVRPIRAAGEAAGKK